MSAAFLKKKAEDPANRQIVMDGLYKLMGMRWRISYELREDLDATNGDGASYAYTEEEWIQRFQSELDAEEVDIESESAPAHAVESAPAHAVEPAPAHNGESAPAHAVEPAPAHAVEPAQAYSEQEGA